jgi:hypothetical protein
MVRKLRQLQRDEMIVSPTQWDSLAPTNGGQTWDMSDDHLASRGSFSLLIKPVLLYSSQYPFPTTARQYFDRSLPPDGFPPL